MTKSKKLVSFLVPTRNRVIYLQKSIDSVLKHLDNCDDIEFIIRIDDDDEATINSIKNMPFDNLYINGQKADYSKNLKYDKLVDMHFVIGPRGAGYALEMPTYVQDAFKYSSGKWLFIWTDDEVMLSDNWYDEIVRLDSMDKIVIAKLNEWYYSLIPREIPNFLGYISPVYAIDCWIDEMARALNIYEPTSITIAHDKASGGQTSIDRDNFRKNEVYPDYIGKLPQVYNEDLEKLRDFIMKTKRNTGSKIYGLFGGSHNANVVYIENGEIIAAIEEERLTRKKSGLDFGRVPRMAIEKITEMTGVKLSEADYVCWCLPSPDIFRKELNLQNEVFYEHHDCHGANAYYTSGFEGKVLVVTLDGGGRRSYGKVFLAENGKMEMVRRMPMELTASLGQLWMQITEFFGWKMLKDEGKIMGMAGHGHYDKKIYRELNQCVRYENGEFYPAGNIGEIILLCQSWKDRGYFKDDSMRRIIAYNLQKLTENLVVDYITDLHKLYPEYTKLAVSGGIFANVKMNQMINELDWLEEMYIVPPMGDDGLGLGAAILKSVELGEYKFKRLNNVFLGVSYSDEEILNEWKKYKKEMDYIPYDVKYIAKKLNDGKIVGFFKNRFEYGPRALGARSILVRPTDKSTHEELNNRLNRHEIMPFAPIVLAEEANTVFYCNKSQYTAEFMTMCYTTRDEWIERIPAVIHMVDKTARPQIVRQDKNPDFYNILNEYYKISGIPVLLNTSFNSHSEPIINSIEIAMKRLYDGVIDILVAGNYTFMRNNNER